MRSARAVNFLRQMGFSRGDQPRRRHRRLEHAGRPVGAAVLSGTTSGKGRPQQGRPLQIPRPFSFRPLRDTPPNREETPWPPIEDAKLILHLYELRREPRMREARDWFVRHFQAKTMEEFHALCPPGSEANASYRMVADLLGDGRLLRRPRRCSTASCSSRTTRSCSRLGARPGAAAAGPRGQPRTPRALKNVEQVAGCYIEWWDDAGARVPRRLRRPDPPAA